MDCVWCEDEIIEPRHQKIEVPTYGPVHKHCLDLAALSVRARKISGNMELEAYLIPARFLNLAFCLSQENPIFFETYCSKLIAGFKDG